MVSIRNASSSSDSTYAGFFIALWKVLEVTFGVKCGCLPAMKPLFRAFLPRSGPGSSGRSKKTRYRSNSFNRLENGVSHSHINSDREIGLQDLRHTTLPHGTIGVTSETIVKSREKADSESEEYMFT
jgi:hypothetical protein